MMSDIMDKMCRTCLAVDTAMLSLFESQKSATNSHAPSSVAEMLSAFASVTISERDGLPKKACLSCISEINRAYFFKIKCENSQNTLKGYLQQSINEKESNEPDDITVYQDVKMECDDEVLLFKTPVNVIDHQEKVVSQKADDEIEVNQNDLEGYTDKKMLKCLNCRQEFKNVYQFSTHVMNCCADKSSNAPKKLPFKCPHCSASFSKPRSCYRHVLMSHPTEVPSDTETENSCEYSEVEKQDDEECSSENQSEIIMPQPFSWKYESTNDVESEKISDNDSKGSSAISRTEERRSSQYVPVPVEDKLNVENLELKTVERSYENNDEELGVNQEDSVEYEGISKSITNQDDNNVNLKTSAKQSELVSYKEEDPEHYYCKQINKSEKCLASDLIIHENNAKASIVFNERERAAYNGIMKHQCVLCLTVFSRRNDLTAHLRTHRNEKLSCMVCYKSFKEMKCLKAHIKRHAVSKPYKCEQCEKSFISRFELNSHSKKHSESTFICNICGAAFRANIQLTQHKELHSEDRRFGCKVCKLRFTSVQNLQNHRIIHLGHRPFICKICGKDFLRKGDCKRHAMTHKM